MKKIIPILFLLTSLFLNGQQGTMQIGTNVLNKGAKGELIKMEILNKIDTLPYELWIAICLFCLVVAYLPKKK